MTPRLLAALLACLPTLACGGSAAPAVQDGDIIFQVSQSAQSLAIQRATNSPYSHVGIVLYSDGQPRVFEAIATVQSTPLADWIARGKDGHFIVKRLADAAERLTPEAVQRLNDSARQFEGRSYDLTFEWSDQRLYCSELVWKLYDRALQLHVGDLQQLKEFNLTDPAVRAKLAERYGNNVPLEETVISPAAMFASPLLVTVTER